MVIPHRFSKNFSPTTLSRKSGRGFTLIELMIAIFILSVGILAVFLMFPLGIQIMKSSEMATIGTQLSQEKVEEVISCSYEIISVGLTTESPLPPPFDAYRRETRVSCVDPLLGLQEVATDQGIKKIEVTVFWKSPLGITEKSIKIETLISKR
jgi:prepilin-type N-terminal cleavage/methylation domain-containing protein